MVTWPAVYYLGVSGTLECFVWVILITMCCPKDGFEVFKGPASFPCWDIKTSHFEPTVVAVCTSYRIADNIFLRVPLTHLDRWLAFSTKFPGNFKSWLMLPHYYVNYRVEATQINFFRASETRKFYSRSALDLMFFAPFVAMFCSQIAMSRMYFNFVQRGMAHPDFNRFFS